MKVKTILAEILIVSVLCGLALAEWTEPVPITEVNTEYAEWTPFLSFDGLSLYFARGQCPAFYDFRIYEATRQVPYGPFTSVGEISGTLNSSPGNVLSPWISPDNLRMYYFTESNLVYKLKVTERASENGPWPVGINIPGLDALGGRPQAPSLTADELIIVFSSYNAPGGVGGFDLWMATRPDKYSSFGNVRNLTEINTAYKESKPYISPDGLTLYFPTDRNGSGQLFRATRTSLTLPFGNLEHLSFFDVPRGGGHPSLSSDGTALYMAKTISGIEDIYVSYWINDPYDDAVTAILDAITEKLEALEKVNAALEKEWEAYEALQELLDSGDYGYISKGDIVTAMQKAYSAIKHEELSRKTLERSIEKLQDTLAALGWEPPQPVSHWAFDEGEGTTAYDSVGTNHGTVYSATWTTGQFSGALSFDGVDDYVDMADTVKNYLETSYTFSTWIKPNTIPGVHSIAAYRRSTYDIGYQALLQLQHNNGDVQFIVGSLGNNAIASYPDALTTNAWYHIVGIREGNVLNVYVNGVSGISDSQTLGEISPDNFKIGAIHCCGQVIQSFFDGAIDDVKIFNKALSMEEIKRLYHNGLAG